MTFRCPETNILFNIFNIFLVCGKEDILHLQRHIRTTHGIETHKKCPHCAYHAPYIGGLQVHIDGKHPECYKKQISCIHCSRKFIFEHSRKMHLHKLQHRKQLVCKICNLQFSKVQELMNHATEMHKEIEQTTNFDEEKPTVMTVDEMAVCKKTKEKALCDLCDFESEVMEALKKHKLQKHQDGEFKCCLYCDFKIKTWNRLKLHIEENHPEHGEKKHLCDLCDEGFIFEETCQSHKRNQHQKDICHVCGKQDILKQHRHIQPNNGIEEDGYNMNEIPSTTNMDELALYDKETKEKAVCDICNFECACKETLKTHKLQNHQDGKYKCCFYCDFKCLSWDNLKIHIDQKHPEHGVKKYVCGTCGRDYIFKASLQRHKAQNHQKRVCHICGNEFFNKASLKDHLSTIHKIGTMSLVCKMCPYSTTSKGCLRSHIQAKHTVKNHKKCPYCDYHTHMIHRIHVHIDSKHPEHDKKQFSCDHCQRKFIFENSLKQHMDNIKNGRKKKRM